MSRPLSAMFGGGGRDPGHQRNASDASSLANSLGGQDSPHRTPNGPGNVAGSGNSSLQSSPVRQQALGPVSRDYYRRVHEAKARYGLNPPPGPELNQLFTSLLQVSNLVTTERLLLRFTISLSFRNLVMAATQARNKTLLINCPN